MERLKGMLAAHQAREERRRAADAEALSRLKQAYAASKAAEAPGAAAAALRAGMHGLSLKPLDLCRIFEAERANLAEAAAVAAAEARAAEAQLERARVGGWLGVRLGARQAAVGAARQAKRRWEMSGRCCECARLLQAGAHTRTPPPTHARRRRCTRLACPATSTN